MCGIAGLIGRRPDGLAVVNAMLDAIAHRGPDDRAVSRPAAGVVFGHVRLSIIDLSSAGRQPMTGAGEKQLIFNGEIYNYVELRRELGDSYDFRSRSDTEVILAAYDKWGARCVERLDGMFAFALWDARARAVLLARDRVGIKPLYVASAADGTVLFASEIKALLANGLVGAKVNADRLFDFLAVRMLDHTTQTMFVGVEQLAPGTTTWIDVMDGSRRRRRYWRLPNVPEKERRPLSAGVVKEFRTLLDEVLEIHLRSDVPLGVFVSGGLDSSTIACLAARHYSKPADLHLVSARLVRPTAENALVPEVQRATGGTLHERYQTASEFVADFAGVLFHHDEPFADASMYAHYDLCRTARRAGVTVLLSGNGGDEVLGGYHFYLFALLGHRLRRGRLGAWSRLARRMAQENGYSFPRLLERSISYAMPQCLRDAGREWTARRSPLLRREFFKDGRLQFFRGYPGRDLFSEYVLNGLERYTLPGFLHYEDRNSMAFGVEVRVPFLDHRLLEFAAGLRPEALVGAGRTKEL